MTASIASLTGSADLLAYQTSKHGVVGLIRAAAMYGGPLGIRVNGVAPGIVPTELFAAASSVPGGKNDMARRASTTPLRRAGTPEEIAGVVSFLAQRGLFVHHRPGLSATAARRSSIRSGPRVAPGRGTPGRVDRAIYGRH